MIVSRAENETISSAADVLCEFGAGNGNFFRAELCSGAFRADIAADSRAGGYISLFRAGLAPFSHAELCSGAFWTDMVADSRAEGMALTMQEPWNSRNSRCRTSARISLSVSSL